jgi:hypothetical protein
MMVVAPAFAEGEQGKKPVFSALVWRFEATAVQSLARSAHSFLRARGPKAD